MKTVRVTDYTNQTPSKHVWTEKMFKLNTPKNEKILLKCAQNRRCASSICEQSLCKVRKNRNEYFLELPITQTRHPKSVADVQTGARTEWAHY